MVRSTGTGSLAELAWLFLKLGTISVGGPAAHIALMHDEVVVRRRWLTAQEFLDLVGATNLIPGPNSTEMAIHIGRVRAGWPGLVIAGGCFILPAVLIVGLAAAFYARMGALPQIQALFYGIKPVVIGIVGVALWQLGRTSTRSLWHVALALAALAGIVAGLHELLVLAACGVLGGFVQARRERRLNGSAHLWVFPLLPAGHHVPDVRIGSGVGVVTALAVAAPAVAVVTFGKLFLVFLKAGAFLFGSGYVLLAFLRADLVDRLGWLTERQLLDAVAIGQVTPGPVFTTATFVGYLLGGAPGAVVATLAIFLPAFVYVALSGHVVPRLRRSPVTAGVLDGVNLASLALMAAVAFQLGQSAIVDITTGAVAIASVVGLLAWRVNSAWLIAGGAIIGLVRGS
jgi:chromate transporter